MDIIAGRFRVDRWLGEGNLGQLYLVEQIETPFRNTLRVLPSVTAGGATPRTPLTDFVTRIQHQNLVRIDEVGQTRRRSDVRRHGPFERDAVVRGGGPRGSTAQMGGRDGAADDRRGPRGARVGDDSWRTDTRKRHDRLVGGRPVERADSRSRALHAVPRAGLPARSALRERGGAHGEGARRAQRRLQPRRRRLSPHDRHAVWNPIAGAESDPTGTGLGAEDGPRQSAGGSLRQRGATRPCAGAGVAGSRGRVEHGNHNAPRDVRPSGEGDSASSDSDSDAGRGEGAAHDVGICTRSRPDTDVRIGLDEITGARDATDPDRIGDSSR